MCILKFSRDGRKGSFIAFPVGAIQHRWNGFQKDGIPIAVEQMQVRGIVVQRIPKPEQPQQPEVRVGVVRPVFRFVGKIRNPQRIKEDGRMGPVKVCGKHCRQFGEVTYQCFSQIICICRP